MPDRERALTAELVGRLLPVIDAGDPQVPGVHYEQVTGGGTEGGDLPVEDLGHEATELLSLVSIGEARSLSRLAALAVRRVPGCSGAHATVWRAGELVNSAATHPDLAALADLEREAGGGPLTTAVREGRDVYCPDTLEEERWPLWAAEALSRGVRSTAHLVRRFPPMTLVLALSGVRPAGLDAGAVPIAEMLAGFGTAALANTMAYGEAQRTATELRDAVAARAVTDQAKGILMHALNCSADEALQFMRRESQQRHIKVTDVAARVIAAYSSQGGAAPPRLPRGPRRLATSPSVPAPAFPDPDHEADEPGDRTKDRRG